MNTSYGARSLTFSYHVLLMWTRIHTYVYGTKGQSKVSLNIFFSPFSLPLRS